MYVGLSTIPISGRPDGCRVQLVDLELKDSNILPFESSRSIPVSVKATSSEVLIKIPEILEPVSKDGLVLLVTSTYVRSTGL